MWTRALPYLEVGVKLRMHCSTLGPTWGAADRPAASPSSVSSSFWTLPSTAFPPRKAYVSEAGKERDAHLEPVTFQMIVRRSC
jgi:hypothetical protein